MATIKHEPKQATEVDRAVGNQIRMARRRVGLTQTDLAKRLNLSFQQVQKYEKGMNRVAAGTLAEIAVALDTPIQFFFPDQFNDKAAARGSNCSMSELKSECRKLINSLQHRDQLDAVHVVLETLANVRRGAG